MSNNFQRKTSDDPAGDFIGKLFWLVPVVVIIVTLMIMVLEVPQQYRLGIIAATLLLMMGFIVFGAGWAEKRLQLNPAQEMQKVGEAIKIGDYVSAKAYADNLYAQAPAIEGNFTVAFAYGASGDTQRAKELVQEALTILKAQPTPFANAANRSRYLWMLGAMHLAEDNYTEATEAFNQALQDTPDAVPVYASLAEVVLYQKGSPQTALEYLETAFKLNQQKPAGEQLKMLVARLDKAWALTLLNDQAAADAIIREVFALVDQDNRALQAELYHVAGHIALARNAHSEAQEYFQRAIATDPNGLSAQLARKAMQR